MEETSPLLGRSNYDAEKAKEVLPINKKKKYQILGGLAAITSSLAFAIYNTLVKRYHQDVVDVLLIRSMFEICVFGSFAKWKGHKFWPDKSLCDTPKMYYLKCFLLVFQGFCAGMVMILCFAAVSAIPIGDALTLMYSNPLFAMIFSSIFLGSRLRLYTTFLFPKNIIIPSNSSAELDAHQLVNRSSTEFNLHHLIVPTCQDDFHYYIGVTLAISAAIFTSTMSVIINYLKEFNQNVLMFYSGLLCSLQLMIVVLFDGKSKLFYDPSNANFGQIFLLAGISVIGLWLSVKCFQLISPPIASIFRTQEIIFAFTLQSYLSQTFPNILTICGAGLVIFSAICIPLEQIVLKKLPI